MAPVLRARLAAILGTPRFATNGYAIDALLSLVGGGAGDQLATAGLAGLRVIGDVQTGVALERLVWSLRSGEVKKRAVEVMVQLDGPDANRALQRLLASATTTGDRELVIAFLSTADPDAALEVFRQASLLEDRVRLQAAHAITSSGAMRSSRSSSSGSATSAMSTCATRSARPARR